MYASRINGSGEVFNYVISVSRYSLRLRGERTSIAPNKPKIESSQKGTLEQEEDSFEGRDLNSPYNRRRRFEINAAKPKKDIGGVIPNNHR